LLLLLERPWLWKAVCDAVTLEAALLSWRQSHRTVEVFVLDGRAMRTSAGFYDEFARALALPDYFGRNLNALGECLADPDVMRGGGFAILIRHGAEMLCEAPAEALDGAVDTLEAAGAEWAVPVTTGNAGDRPAAPFHTIVQLDRSAGRLADLPSFATVAKPR